MRRAVQRLYLYFAPLRARWLVAACALGFVHVIEAAIPLQLQAAVDGLAQGRAAGGAAAMLLALALLRLLVLHFGRRRNALISTDIAFALRKDLFEQLCRLDARFYSGQRIGDLMARATQDVETVRRFFRSGSHRLISLVAVSLIAPLVVFAQSPLLAAVLAPAALLTLLALTLLASRVRTHTSSVQAGFGELSEAIQQNLIGIRTIQLHGQERYELAQLTGTLARYRDHNSKLLTAQAGLTAASTLGSGLMTWTVLIVGAHAVLSSSMTIGTLVAFLSYLTILLFVLREAAWPVFGFLGAAGAIGRIFEILDRVPLIRDGAADPARPRLTGRIEARGISYAFSQGRPVLDDVSLTVEPGELVAIVGRVGAGKSTLLRCLARQLDPDAGEITLDGHLLHDFSLQRLRGELTFVSQECALFSTSLSENIAYDDPTRPESSIWAAAESAELASTIARFPDQLATLVGERGVKLSGGQRQRTVLARGLIRRTPVLLLDDCLSALDAETEAAVLGHLQAQRAQQSVVLVTHRARAARIADRIYVLEAGRVLDSGTHTELLARCDYYRALHDVHTRLPPAREGHERISRVSV